MNDELSQWLQNGEMAENNPEAYEQVRGVSVTVQSPGTRAVTIQEIDAQGSDGRFRYERDLQMAVFAWAERESENTPELAMLYAIPNGGHRHISVAAQMKREGARAGVPDICLPVSRGGYGAVYIELKVGKKKPTPLQARWLRRLREYGNKTAVCRDLPSVQALLISYLKGEK